MRRHRQKNVAFVRAFDPVFWGRIVADPYYRDSSQIGTGEFTPFPGDTPFLLHRRLKRLTRHLPDVVLIGRKADPYPPQEKRERITRRLCEVVAHYRCPVCIVTNSPLILRDIDLLYEIHEQARSSVVIKLPSVRQSQSRHMDPDGPAPHLRLKALERLRHRGIHTGVIIEPMVRGVNDQASSLKPLFKVVADLNLDFLLLPSRILEPNNNAFDGFKPNNQDKRLTRSYTRQIIETASEYGIKLNIKRYLPKDFRHENYWLAEKLVRTAERRRLDGLAFRELISTARRVNNLKVDIRNIIAAGGLQSQEWIDYGARSEMMRLLDGTWAMQTTVGGWD